MIVYCRNFVNIYDNTYNILLKLSNYYVIIIDIMIKVG
jgi:hypothetical protein